MKKGLIHFFQVASIHQNGPTSVPPVSRHQHPAGLRLPNHSHATVHHPTGITISHRQGPVGVHHSPTSSPSGQTLHHPPVSQGSQHHPPGNVPVSQTLHHPPANMLNSQGNVGLHHQPTSVPSSLGHGVFHSGAPALHSQAQGTGLRPGAPTSQAAGQGMSNAFSTTPHSAAQSLHSAGIPAHHGAMHIASTTASSNSHGLHQVAGVVTSQSHSGGVTVYSTGISHSTATPHSQGHGTLVPATTASHGHVGLYHMGVPSHSQHVRTPSPGSRGQSPHHAHGPPSHHPAVSSTSSQVAVQARCVEEKQARSAPSPSVSTTSTVLEGLPHHSHSDRGASSQAVSDVHNAVTVNSLPSASAEVASKGVVTCTMATSASGATGGCHRYADFKGDCWVKRELLS